jgi:hypothetical protein
MAWHKNSAMRFSDETCNQISEREIGIYRARDRRLDECKMLVPILIEIEL